MEPYDVDYQRSVVFLLNRHPVSVVLQVPPRLPSLEPGSNSLTECVACKCELTTENHKLMSCLHAICLECVEDIKVKADLATKDADDEVCALIYYLHRTFRAFSLARTRKRFTPLTRRVYR